MSDLRKYYEDMSPTAFWMLGVAIRSGYRAALRRNGEMTDEYLRSAARNEVEQYRMEMTPEGREEFAAKLANDLKRPTDG